MTVSQNGPKATPVEPVTSIEKLPLNEQPGELTQAHLEATISTPLHPGIEMSWNTELP